MDHEGHQSCEHLRACRSKPRNSDLHQSRQSLRRLHVKARTDWYISELVPRYNTDATAGHAVGGEMSTHTLFSAKNL
eukprot:2932053-Amphidinium_carterae.1